MLKEAGIVVSDKTSDDKGGFFRGAGIRNWLSSHNDSAGWIVLDDYEFGDFEKEGILGHLVLIDSGTGLQDDHVYRVRSVMDRFKIE